MLQHILPILTAGHLAQAYTVTVVDQFMRKNIDPIVMPGQYKSHVHSFYGSDAVTLSTNTSAELQAGCSTAENPNDFSIYWIPTLYHVDSAGEHTPITPARFSAYYVSIENAEVAIPQNYKSVAGNASATSQSDVDDLAGISWFCENEDTDESKDAAAFPTSTCSTHIQTLLLFHDCINEDTLESTYSGTQNWSDDFKPLNRCPADMKRMPQLRFSIRYDVRDILPEGWSGTPPLALASGSSYSSHGDFINGWLPEAADDMLLCNDKREYRGVSGPNGSDNVGSVCTGTATDADPSNGTDDYETSLEMEGSKRVVRREQRRL